MTGIDEVILCHNKAKNAGIAIDTARLFNEVSVQKNESKRVGYFITIPKRKLDVKVYHSHFYSKWTHNTPQGRKWLISGMEGTENGWLNYNQIECIAYFIIQLFVAYPLFS
jgi:hypothetical protein